MSKGPAYTRPMRVQIAAGSDAAKAYVDQYYQSASLPGRPFPAPAVIAPGVKAAPLHDLIFHGGKTVEDMQYQNVFLGAPGQWTDGDMKNVDAAILAAMRDDELNNVMLQYFPGSASLGCAPRDFDHDGDTQGRGSRRTGHSSGRRKPSQGGHPPGDRPRAPRSSTFCFPRGKSSRSETRTRRTAWAGTTARSTSPSAARTLPRITRQTSSRRPPAPDSMASRSSKCRGRTWLERSITR
jgi:hypothetical protein